MGRSVEVGAPDDPAWVIAEFVEQATDTVDVAVQELDDIPIAEALIRLPRNRRAAA